MKETKQHVGICTMSTGFNYGSALQAYALKRKLEQLGYTAEVYRLSGSMIPDRDARRGKIFIMRVRSFLHQRDQIIRPGTPLHRSKRTISLFHEFYVRTLRPETVSWKELRKRARLPHYAGFFCGSDQIWNTKASYVDPLNYLRFAPRNKRIAFAPSLGNGSIPPWNEQIMRRWIREIPYLSVREESGRQLIRDLTGREAEVLLDPVFLLTKENWIEEFSLKSHSGKYCLAYFLNPLSDAAKAVAEQYTRNGYEMIFLPYEQANENMTAEDAGPLEFLRLVYGAEAILTDSFHALAFSILFHKPVYAYRKPGATDLDQPMRLMNLLQMLGMEECLDRSTMNPLPTDYETADRIINAERQKAVDYLLSSLKAVRENTRSRSRGSLARIMRK